ncbi:MAG: RnfABCDGE type electron transport complex subunit G [Mangrovibacterium sp.]
MADKKSGFVNMVLTLFLVTFIASFVLGLVQDMTSGAIEAAGMKAQNEAIKSILPAFNTLGKTVMLAPREGGDSLELFPAYDSSKELVGVAIRSYSKNGFGGRIEIITGFDPQGTVTGYQVLSHKETPGLGSKMENWFKDPGKAGQNIIGKNPAKSKFRVSKDGGDIDAITASTITSRAFLEAVCRAYESWKELPAADGITAQTKLEKGEKTNESVE